MELSTFLKTTRQYFWGKNFTEVETKYLNKTLPLEPNIFLFQTQDYFLPASPEFACKEFLVKNKSDCFSLAHSFRVEQDISPIHFPEFMMLEYYLVNKNVVDLQKSLELFLSQFANFKFETLNLPDNLPNNEPDFNEYFLNEIESKLPKDKAVFVSGYPAFLSPLSKFDEVNNFSEHSERGQVYAPPEGSEHRKNSFTNQISQRFELYINGIEIANGCEENRDSESIRKAFEAENNRRLQNDLPTHPYPNDFIENCSQLPPCSGVAMGIDRLLQIINKN